MRERRLYQRAGDPSRTGAEKFLGELESEVMEVVWRHGSVPVRQAVDLLNRDRAHPVAYTTILTVMQRLVDKGLLTRAVIGHTNTHRYAARQSREDFMSESSRRIIHALVADLGDLALTHFLAEIDNLDPERLRRLRDRAGLEGGDDPS